ncbi:MAG: DUF22 domain-containing protein [Methanosarcinales archaeon]|nr:DUF22 domain-containing protein [Methanosarcinales archaeon]
MPAPQDIRLVVCLGDAIEHENVEAVPYSIMLSNRGKWEMLVADNDTSIKANEMKEINVGTICIPVNCLALPDAYNYHGLGSVMDIRHEGLALVETERCINKVNFIASYDGVIKKGDLLGVVTIFPVIIEQS